MPASRNRLLRTGYSQYLTHFAALNCETHPCELNPSEINHCEINQTHEISMTFKPLAVNAAVHVVILTAALSGLASSVYAQTDAGKDALYVKSLAATCANCHGTNGKSAEGSTVPSLAGLGKDYQIAQMAAFKNGTRPATIMHQLSKGYSDAQIELLASYFAAQKK